MNPHEVAAIRGFTNPACGNLRSDSLRSHLIDMPHSACHLLRGSRPDVYAGSVPKPKFRSYFAVCEPVWPSGKALGW